jgi:hypothetical protein
MDASLIDDIDLVADDRSRFCTTVLTKLLGFPIFGKPQRAMNSILDNAETTTTMPPRFSTARRC